MGGLGSGTWYRFNKKALADHCQAIEVLDVYKTGLLYNCTPYSFTWAARPNYQTGVNLQVLLNRQAIAISYVLQRNGEHEYFHYRIGLTYSPCNYGGQRPWFICPGCSRRVGKLFLGGKYFWCRHCCNLAYSSQNSRLRKFN